MSESEEIQKLRRKFLQAHNDWLAVNNPVGWESGEVRKYFEERTEALLNLVREKEIYKIDH